MPYACKVSILPDCCGAVVLHQLFKNPDPFLTKEDYNQWSGHGSYFWGNYPTEEAVQTLLKKETVNQHCEVLEDYKKRVRSFLTEYIAYYKGKRSYLLCSLNPKEKQFGVEDMLLDSGFEILVPETRNPNGTSITLYIYHLLPKQVEEVKSILGK